MMAPAGALPETPRGAGAGAAAGAGADGEQAAENARRTATRLAEPATRAQLPNGPAWPSVELRMTITFRSLLITVAAAYVMTVAGTTVAHTQSLAPATAPARFDMAVRADFFAGFGGDTQRFDRAMALCEKTLEGNPGHAEAMVWHGGGLIFRAGTAFQAGDYAKGGELWSEGMTEMGKAVSLAPDNVGVRIPRAAVLIEASRNMPAPQAAPVLKLGVDDYERVLELQKSYMEKLSDHSRGELLFALADGWARLGDPVKARDYFTRLTTGAATSGRADYATAWLDGKALPTAPRCVGCHK